MTSAREAYTSLSELFKIAFPDNRKGRSFAVMAEILDTFMDESSDQEQKDVFCVAAVLANEKIYRPLEDEWVKRLDEDGIKYFRASDCKSVRGAFEHLRKKCGSFEAAKKVADAVREDLEHLLIPSHWIGFGAGVIVPEYKAVLREFPEARFFFSEDETVPAYTQVMYEVAREVRKKAKGFGVAYIVDDSTYSEKIVHAFYATKKNHPTVGTSMKTIAPLDDKETPALQMADLFASVVKDIFLDWLAHESSGPDLGEWHSHVERIGRFDKAVMAKSLLKTFKSSRFAKGTLARQFIPERKMTKSEIKQQRRALVRKLLNQVEFKDVQQ
ncbi:MAG: DUF3800 domain-containing protein [Terriglobia bacterium]